MLDIKRIRKDKEILEKLLQTKDPEISLSPILELDEKIRTTKTSVEDLKSERNALSKEIGEKKRAKEDASSLMEKAEGFGNKIAALDKELLSLEETFERQLSCIPNAPMEGIKVSLDPKDNVCVKTVGEKPSFSFPFKNHVELNESLHLFDFPRGAKVAGSGWSVYKGLGAQLEWALINYMVDIHIEAGFTMWMVPHLVKPEMMFGSGQLPKFEKQLFKIVLYDLKYTNFKIIPPHL